VRAFQKQQQVQHNIAIPVNEFMLSWYRARQRGGEFDYSALVSSASAGGSGGGAASSGDVGGCDGGSVDDVDGESAAKLRADLLRARNETSVVRQRLIALQQGTTSLAIEHEEAAGTLPALREMLRQRVDSVQALEQQLQARLQARDLAARQLVQRRRQPRSDPARGRRATEDPPEVQRAVDLEPSDDASDATYEQSCTDYDDEEDFISEDEQESGDEEEQESGDKEGEEESADEEEERESGNEGEEMWEWAAGLSAPAIIIMQFLVSLPAHSLQAHRAKLRPNHLINPRTERHCAAGVASLRMFPQHACLRPPNSIPARCEDHGALSSHGNARGRVWLSCVSASCGGGCDPCHCALASARIYLAVHRRWADGAPPSPRNALCSCPSWEGRRSVHC
jgi:hypothetical protein